MNDVETSAVPAQKGRKALVTQAALVLTLIVALLAVLVISDSAEPPVEQQSLLQSSAPAPRIGVAVSAAASSLSEALKEEINNAPDMAQTALENTSTSSASSSSFPVVPEESSDASLRISERAAATVSSAKSMIPPVRKEVLSQSPSSRSSSSIASSQVVDASGFALQLGVFSNVSNAEALQRKLKRAGINSQLETRVQLGPFRSKEEALQAQDKLRRLGLATGMMLPLQKRHE